MSFMVIFTVQAQHNDHGVKGRKHRQGPDRLIGVFINPLSPLEPQQGAVGAGINVMLAHRWDISLELNYLFEGFVQDMDDYSSHGYRGIFSVKRFSKSRIFFYGIDTRLKYFSFTDKQNFASAATPDTLFNFRYNGSNTLFGIAAITGLRLPISKNKKWAFELQTGIGNKYRDVSRKNIPSGYYYFNSEKSIDLNVLEFQKTSGGFNFYFPSAIRIMYFF
ncbi:MAG: hypothetical protein JST02_01680 [Bacteroidetes bacterium]|nr:hypothetical protein [Bacteroidota bacterium]